MKKTFLVLPFCLFFAFCSHKTVPPPATGISNVNVKNEDGTPSSVNATATTGGKDWGYSAVRDTSLSGTWALEGMLAADGTWSTPKADSPNAAVGSVADTAMAVGNNAEAMTGKKGKKQKGNAAYEGAKARLKMDYKAGSAIDTTAPEPYKYWTQTPRINFSKSAFTGNTGCNSMSGTVNYNNKDIEFGHVSSSKMACYEYNEANFLSLLKRANSYTLTGNLLEIKQGSTLLMRLRKS